MIPEALKKRLELLGIPEDVYKQRTRKCVLSQKAMNLELVPWCSQAYLLPEEKEGKKVRIPHSFRDYFVFDPVSLVPCLALSPLPTDTILDMCAAPGTKTFILSFFTNNEAHITANDIDENRVKRLKSNVNKFNLSVKVTDMSGRKLKGSFNKILVDAPCSGEGMVNKGHKVFAHWSEKRIKMLAKKQKKLLLHAFDLLEPNGVLVYATCTFEPEENEMVVDNLLSKRKGAELEPISIKINHANGLTGWKGHNLSPLLVNCMRIYPQHNATSGFFVCRIRKLK